MSLFFRCYESTINFELCKLVVINRRSENLNVNRYRTNESSCARVCIVCIFPQSIKPIISERDRSQ